MTDGWQGAAQWAVAAFEQKYVVELVTGNWDLKQYVSVVCANWNSSPIVVARRVSNRQILMDIQSPHSAQPLPSGYHTFTIMLLFITISFVTAQCRKTNCFTPTLPIFAPIASTYACPLRTRGSSDLTKSRKELQQGRHTRATART